MVFKILIGLIIYFLALTLMCMFFKGATKNVKEYEEKREQEEILDIINRIEKDRKGTT